MIIKTTLILIKETPRVGQMYCDVCKKPCGFSGQPALFIKLQKGYCKQDLSDLLFSQ
jgi:hypothetical protein